MKRSGLHLRLVTDVLGLRFQSIGALVGNGVEFISTISCRTGRRFGGFGLISCGGILDFARPLLRSVADNAATGVHCRIGLLASISRLPSHAPSVKLVASTSTMIIGFMSVSLSATQHRRGKPAQGDPCAGNLAQ
jgi:hypothetical protein